MNSETVKRLEEVYAVLKADSDKGTTLLRAYIDELKRADGKS